MEKHRTHPLGKLLRRLDELTLYQFGNRFILRFKNGTEKTFDCIDTAKREMLYAFFKIIENRNRKFIS